jgi:hypothetical protein
MNFWAKFVLAIPSRTIQLKVFHYEAILTLLYAYFILHLLPFRVIEHIMSNPPGRTEVYGERRRQLIQAIVSKIYQISQAMPFEIVCFPRCLASQMILRRYGIYATVNYGAATFPEKGLTAHTWLHDPVTGLSEQEHMVENYQILACYPHVN